MLIMKISMQLFTALFPRWNFFDQVGYQFKLEVKFTNEEQWKQIDFTQKRSVFGIFVNSKLNIALSQIHILEKFVQELQANDLAYVEQHTGYKMLCSLVRFKTEDHSLESRSFQFRILAFTAAEEVSIYTSPVIQRETA